MLNQPFHHAIEAATTNQLRSALHLLLRPHAEPVFGAAKTVEHEVAALNALKVLGHIDRTADEYDLVEKLRVTKSKARSLLYQAALRAEHDVAQIDTALRHALHTTRLFRDGGLYLIEIPDPLMMDRLRKRIRSYGYLSDGSFSGSIAKIPEAALLRLVADLIPADKKVEIDKRLIEAGMADLTVPGAIKAMLGKVAKQALGEVGEQVGNAVGEQIARLFVKGWEELKSVVKK